MNRITTIAAALLLAVQLAPAAPPEIVGNYSGTITFKKFNHVSGIKTSEKLGILLTINQDNSFVMTDSNNGSSQGTGAFGLTSGFLAVSEPTSVITAPIHFKNGAVKGLIHIGQLGANATLMIEGKLALRKI